MIDQPINGEIDSEPDFEAITLAAKAAVARALHMKKCLGFPAAVWRNGRVVVIPPEEIVVDEALLKQNVMQAYIID